MMTTLSVTDADLLARYLHCGDECAFAALVRAHERLVIGTAARVTGDAEMARDVAQQVFATLAQKAWMLGDRPSLAGWLHHAARHIALRMARNEQARHRRHERAAADGVAASAGDPWPALEESLAALREAEREAVVMHYLEDRSYSQMAAALGVNEAAVRKRVSRGLQSLGAQLRQRGYRGAPAVLLAGAAAMQMGAAPVAVAAGAASFSLTPLTLMTLMSHTAAKLTAAAFFLAALPIAWQTHANSELRDQLTTLQSQSRPPAPKPLPVPDNTALRVEAATLAARFATARQAQQDATSELVAMQAEVRRLSEEVVVSYGTPEDIGRALATTLRPLFELQHMMEIVDSAKRPLNAEETEAVKRLTTGMLEISQMKKAVFRMEDRPADSARLFTTLFDVAFKLPADVRTQLGRALVADFERLKVAGLTASHRPKEDAEDWHRRRMGASYAMAARLDTLLPPKTREHPFFELLSASWGGRPGFLPNTDLEPFEVDARATPPKPVSTR